MGVSWAIVPELLTFTNPFDVPLFENHPKQLEIQELREENGILPVDEVWIISTVDEIIDSAVDSLKKWFEFMPKTIPKLRIWRTETVKDLSSIEECRSMGSLIFRAVLHALQLHNQD